MKNILNKIVPVLRLIFGYGIMISLFGGVLLFLGYLIALILGGEAAVTICNVLYKQVVPFLVYLTTSCVLLGLVTMYLSGEFALTASKK